MERWVTDEGIDRRDGGIPPRYGEDGGGSFSHHFEDIRIQRKGMQREEMQREGMRWRIFIEKLSLLQHLKKEQGFSLMEMMFSLFLFTLLLSSLLPLLPLLREREERLQREISLEQEAIRFYSYMENRNMALRSWEMQGQYSVRIDTYGRGSKRYLHDGYRIVEIDPSSSPGGSLYLAHDVHKIHFTSADPFLIMEITLGSGDVTRHFRGILPRYIESGEAP